MWPDSLETKHTVESNSDLMNSNNSVWQRTGSCFISHGGSAVYVTTADLSLHLLAAMGTSVLHLHHNQAAVCHWNRFMSHLYEKTSHSH